MRKPLIGMLVVIFLLAGAAGAAYSGALMGHDGMGTIGCPLMGHDAAVCAADPLEHIGVWKVMFAATPTHALAALLLLAAALILPRFSTALRLPHPSPRAIRVLRDPEAAAHDSLRRFIFRGLMHPKVF